MNARHFLNVNQNIRFRAHKKWNGFNSCQHWYQYLYRVKTFTANGLEFHTLKFYFKLECFQATSVRFNFVEESIYIFLRWH